jgi:hypothetical protein
MTWIKPSFAWVLYRSGYGTKHDPTRVLKVKVPHAAVAALLAQCKCAHGGGGALGRAQWDPARDLLTAEDGGREPRRKLRERAIQIGLKGRLSEEYVRSVTSIEDVTGLAHRVRDAHRAPRTRDETADAAVAAAMARLAGELPHERAYTPRCDDDVLRALQLRVR